MLETEEEEPTAKVLDLMEALRASLDGAPSKRSKTSAKKPAKKSTRKSTRKSAKKTTRRRTGSRRSA